MGDFNKLIHIGEKNGRGHRPAKQMDRFCKVINRCGLRDMGFVGQEFTWSRKRGAYGWVQERLDRALVSTSWVSCFPRIQVHHKAASTSNHYMLLLRDMPSRCKSTARAKPFRIEAMWLQDKSCGEVVDRAWERGTSSTLESIFIKCLEECRLSLTTWNKNNFGHMGRKVVSLQKKLQWLECQNDALMNMEEVQKTKLELNKILDLEEIMWKQCSWNSWLKEGDRNTSFFHTKASNRNQRNSFLGVNDNNGSW